MMWTFEWRPIGGDRWTARPHTWTTPGGARRAAERWKESMKAEGCEVEVQVGYLVTEGTGKRFQKAGGQE